MRKLLLALAVFSIATVARAIIPAPSAAQGAGVWSYVCCGALCIGGDACTGNGDFSCCKS